MKMNAKNMRKLAEKVVREMDGEELTLAEDSNRVNLEEDCSCRVPMYVFRAKAKKEYVYGLHYVLSIEGIYEDRKSDEEGRLPNCTAEKHYSLRVMSKQKRTAAIQMA